AADVPPVMPEGEEGAAARISFRLTEHLKGRIEEAAAQAGLSVNAWLVRAALHRLGAVAMRPGTTSRHRHPRAMDARVTPSPGGITMPTFDTPGPISA